MKKTTAVILTLIICLLMALSSSAGDVHFGTGTVLSQSQEEYYDVDTVSLQQPAEYYDAGIVSPQQQPENYNAGTIFAGYRAAIYATGADGLALKAEPDINSQRYFYIPEGALIDIDSISGGWGHTVYNGTGGWVALKYTRINGDCSSESASYGYISPAYYVVVNTEGEGLEVRTKPTAEASTFGPCYDGTVILVMAIEENWAYVSGNGHYGWMNLEYLRPWNASASNYQALVYDTKGQGLALMAGPDPGSGSYTVIPEGTALNIDDINEYGWGHIFYNNYSGWVQLGNTRITGDYPSRIPDGGLYSAPAAYVVSNTEGEGLELRTGPGTSFSTFGPLYDGTVVYAHAGLNDWAYVYCNGHFGWANFTYLNKIQSALSDPSPASAELPNHAPASGNSPVWNHDSDPRKPADLPQEQASAANTSAEKDPSGQNGTGTLVVSANIARYNGVTYMLARNNPVSGLTALSITPAIYPYIGAFAFYNERVYYCSKEGGTSDYHTALCTCLPDGSDQKILLDSAQAGDSYFMTRFLLKDDKIYFTQTVSGNITYCYYDLTSDSLITYADPDPEVKDMLSNMRSRVSDGNGTYYTSGANGSGSSRGALYYRDSNGNETLVATSDLSLEIEALTSDYLYFSKYDNGNADLYRVNRSTQTAEYLDGHPAVGGGIYFNW